MPHFVIDCSMQILEKTLPEDILQKGNLSKQIVKALKAIFLEVPIISINIREFEKAIYCNKEMV